MTSQVLENPRSPGIELGVGRTLTAREITRLTAANSSADPRESFLEALAAYRAHAIKRAREELVRKTTVDSKTIHLVMDSIWMHYSPVFKRATASMIAQSYIRAFQKADAGDVPIKTIYALADEHADRVGSYFNETSTEALVQGFNTFVNRQVPAKAAMERVLDAYGLSPRQMSGYTSASASFSSKVESSTPRDLKSKLKAYIGKSIADRLGLFQQQEAHNLDMQATQVAWMWMVEQGKIPEHAQKMWLTAKDEKVCIQCGPMNGKKVGVTGMFKLPNGNKLYVPGAHINCRCQVRLQISPLASNAFGIAKDAREVFSKERWDPREHPRGGNPKNKGQFSRKPATKEAAPDIDSLLKDVQRVREEQARERFAQAVQEKKEVRPLSELGPTPLSPAPLGGQPLAPKPLDPKPLEAKPLSAQPLSRAATTALSVEALAQARAALPVESIVRRVDALKSGDEPLNLHEMLEYYAYEPIPEPERPERRTVVYRPTIHFGGTRFAMGDPYSDIDDQHGVVMVSPDTEFMTYDQAALERQMIDRLDENINYWIEYAVESGAAHLTRQHPVTHERLVYNLGYDELTQIASAVIDEGEMDYASNTYIDVEWMTEEQAYQEAEHGVRPASDISTRYNLLDLAEQIGVYKEEFIPVIYRMEEGYEDGIQHESETKYGYESWRAPGNYGIVDDKTVRDQYPVPVRIITLAPLEENF